MIFRKSQVSKPLPLGQMEPLIMCLLWSDKTMREACSTNIFWLWQNQSTILQLLHVYIAQMYHTSNYVCSCIKKEHTYVTTCLDPLATDTHHQTSFWGLFTVSLKVGQMPWGIQHKPVLFPTTQEWTCRKSKYLIWNFVTNIVKFRKFSMLIPFKKFNMKLCIILN